MRTKTLLSTTKKLAYLGTLAMGLLIALASCESKTTDTGGSGTTAPPYVGTYKVDSVVLFTGTTRYGVGTYAGTVTVEDRRTSVGGTTTVKGQSVNVNAGLILGAGDVTFMGNTLSFKETISSGELTATTFKGMGNIDATVTKLSDTRISIGGIDASTFSSYATGMTATLHLTKK